MKKPVESHITPRELLEMREMVMRENSMDRTQTGQKILDKIETLTLDLLNTIQVNKNPQGGNNEQATGH